jgi:branched-chain amino acid transport system ATP-binding protein
LRSDEPCPSRALARLQALRRHPGRERHLDADRAGKSTVLSLIAGDQRLSQGEILFQGEKVAARSEYERVRAGMARVPQRALNLERCSVFGNVSLGLRASSGSRSPLPLLRFAFASSWHAGALERRGLEVLGQVGLAEKAWQPAASLSHWEKRLLSLGRALATEPRLILLDEPFVGLTPGETELFLDLIERLRTQNGKTFLIVEHNLEAVLQLCDRIVVLHLGEKIADDTPDAIRRDAQVVDVYLGGREWHC